MAPGSGERKRWRSRLRPGDAVHARVMALGADGTLQVEIDGAVLAATAALALQPGLTYELTVLAVEPALVLSAGRAQVRLSAAHADAGGLLAPPAPPLAAIGAHEVDGRRLAVWHRRWCAFLDGVAGGTAPAWADAWAEDQRLRRRLGAAVVVPLPRWVALGASKAFVLPPEPGEGPRRLVLLCPDTPAGMLRVDLGLVDGVLEVGVVVTEVAAMPAVRAALNDFVARASAVGLRCGGVRLRRAPADSVGVADLMPPPVDAEGDRRVDVRA